MLATKLEKKKQKRVWFPRNFLQVYEIVSCYNNYNCVSVVNTHRHIESQTKNSLEVGSYCSL